MADSENDKEQCCRVLLALKTEYTGLCAAWDVGKATLPAPSIKVVCAGSVWHKTMNCQEINEVGHHHLRMTAAGTHDLKQYNNHAHRAVSSATKFHRVPKEAKHAPTLALFSMPLTSKPFTTQYVSQ